MQDLLKNAGNKVDFLPADKHKSVLQLGSVTLEIKSLQYLYLKENVKDEVNFWPAGKRQKFLQIDTMILGVCGQVCPSFPQ